MSGRSTSRSNTRDRTARTLNRREGAATSRSMPAQPPPEVIRVSALQVACDGSGEIAPALGHPRVYLRIDEELGFVECGYCDRRFVLEGGPADQQAA
jgi:NADH dehydrogenase (ubiquinone) Fe-S protein 6